MRYLAKSIVFVSSHLETLSAQIECHVRSPALNPHRNGICAFAFQTNLRVLMATFYKAARTASRGFGAGAAFSKGTGKSIKFVYIFMRRRRRERAMSVGGRSLV